MVGAEVGEVVGPLVDTGVGATVGEPVGSGVVGDAVGDVVGGAVGTMSQTSPVNPSSQMQSPSTQVPPFLHCPLFVQTGVMVGVVLGLELKQKGNASEWKKQRKEVVGCWCHWNLPDTWLHARLAGWCNAGAGLF